MKRQNGFTMVELMVVVAVIVILAGFVLTAVLGVGDTARRTQTEALLMKVDAGLRQFKSDYGVYPLCSGNYGLTQAGGGNGVKTGVDYNANVSATVPGLYHSQTLEPYLGDELASNNLNDTTVITDGIVSPASSDGQPIYYVYYTAYTEASSNAYYDSGDTPTSWPTSVAVGPNAGFRREFQLWSAGADGSYSTFGESSGVDADNITVTDYK